MYVCIRIPLFLCLFVASVTTVTHVICSDIRGISPCDHYPESPYVCKECMKKLRAESPQCVCEAPLLKGAPNSSCPYHYNKYLDWMQKDSPRNDFSDIEPIPEEVYLNPETIRLREALKQQPSSVSSEEETSSSSSRQESPRTPPTVPAKSSREQSSVPKERKSFMDKLRGITKKEKSEKPIPTATQPPAATTGKKVHFNEHVIEKNRYQSQYQ